MSSPQSRPFRENNLIFNIKSGVFKTLSLSFDDIFNVAIERSTWKIWNTKLTVLLEKEGTLDRDTNTTTIEIVAGDFNTLPVGTYEGDVEFKNRFDNTITHSETFTFIVLPSP